MASALSLSPAGLRVQNSGEATTKETKMKVNPIETKEQEMVAGKTVNRLPKKWRDRFDASLVRPGDGAEPASSKPDAEWIAVFFCYGLN